MELYTRVKGGDARIKHSQREREREREQTLHTIFIDRKRSIREREKERERDTNCAKFQETQIHTHNTHTRHTLLALFQRVKNNSCGTHSLLFVLVAFQVNKAFLLLSSNLFPRRAVFGGSVREEFKRSKRILCEDGRKERKEDEDEEEEFSSSSSEESESKSSSESGDDDHDELTMDSDSEQQEEEEEKKETNNAFSRAFTSLLKRGKRKRNQTTSCPRKRKISTMGGREVMMLSSFRNRNRDRRNARFSAWNRKRGSENV